ncbi:MAG TPA: amino acid--[acyl-carrier-protein] ligase [Bryobacteraceae bacterium]|jgi:seryl-tRNA synthetase|nr:amino acid--[acyl-carrier-protein] ligase [Bryobacteraceae bacterium]
MSTAIGILSEQEFLSQLLDERYFLPSGEPGIYGRGMEFERVRTAVDSLITSVSVLDHPETPRFPPLIPRRTLEKAGYLKSFPNLCGAVFSFKGKEAAALDLLERANRGDDWGVHLSMTDVVLVPAACYPAYPAMARRGPLPLGGITLDLGGSYVFRNEPSGDPARLQVFHQREMVRIGDAQEVLAWRETWMARAQNIFRQMELDAKLDIASDPFFGRGGKLLANSQRAQSLKFEVLVPIASDEPTAVSSFNFHQEHFGSAFGIQLHDGRVANSACLGFGLERITLALFRKHGLDTTKWPQTVLRRLWPEGKDCPSHGNGYQR